MHERRNQIRTKLIVTFILLVTVLVVASAMVWYRVATAHVRRETENRLLAVAEAGALVIDPLTTTALVNQVGPRTRQLAEGHLRAIQRRLADLMTAMNGDATLRSRNEPTPPSIVEDVSTAVSGQWYQTYGPTATHRRCYENAATRFQGVLADLRRLIDGDLARLERSADAAGAPWTPGRLPQWEP